MTHQHPVYNHSYVVNASGNAINTISSRMDATKSGRVTTNMVNDVIGQLLQPNAVAEQSVVDLSWVSTPRYVFLLKVRSVDALGITINSYIQGYTDHAGISEATGSANTEMVHFINNVIETTVIEHNTPMGLVRKEKLYKIYNVFAAHNREFFTQRPTDVLDNIGTMQAAEFMGGAAMNITGVNIGNLINPFNNSVITSSVDNAIGTEYLCKIINAGVHDLKNKSIFLNSYEVTDQPANASQIVEPSINDNRFAKYLSRISGYKTVKEYFTLQQLMGVDPTIYARFNLIKLTKNYMDPMLLATPDVGDYWHGQDPITLKAYSLIESATALAMKYGFNKLFFTVTNMANPTAQTDLLITNFKSFISLDEGDYAYLLEIFKSKFISDVFIGETMGGVVPTYAEFYIDLLGTSKIKLGYAGYPENWYTIPTTANSLFNPVVTSDHATLDAVTTQFSMMINEITNSDQQNQIYY